MDCRYPLMALLILALSACSPPPLAETAAPPTPTPTETPPPTPSPLGYAGNPVITNDQWTPILREFDGVQMALVPVGCFMIGSDVGDDDEAPVHQVCFEQPYWIDVYEVTNAQFVALGGQASNESGVYTGDQQPRDRVTWAESQAFCMLRGAHLPTEAAWEYAARGVDSLIYPWGNTLITENAIYRDTSEGRTHDVGSIPAGVSWVGAHDLSGNVWEWTNDWEGAYSAEDQINPQGAPSGEEKILKGGSWDFVANALRASSRNALDPTVKVTVGFRCARDWSPTD